MTTKQLTNSQAIQCFKGVKVKFKSYYKYSFTFTGMFGQQTLSISVGGATSDIYKLKVNTDETDLASLIADGCEGVTVESSKTEIHLWSTW